MSDKLSQYLGYWVKIFCEKYFCTGEIVAIDSNTIVLINSSINDVTSSTRYLGINQTLIIGMDIISSPISQNTATISYSGPNSCLNVYTSPSQPPVIKRGGSSSAVGRNLKRIENYSKEKNLNVRNSNFSDKYSRPRFASSGNVPTEYYLFNVPRNDAYKSRNLSDNNFRTRKISLGNSFKEPSWMSYTFNDDCGEFDFDSNLALFDKNAFYSNSDTKQRTSESYDSSDSGGIYLNFTTTNKPRSHSIGIESQDFSSYDNDSLKSDNNLKSQTIVKNNYKETKDVFTELMHLGIIPTPNCNELNDNCDLKRIPEIVSFGDKFFKDHSFLQQPDIIQEVTKSQFCVSDLQLTSHSVICSINNASKDFQIFSDFWKLDSDSKFPVFTIQQRNKIFECANKHGYNISTIGEYIGKTISEFIVHQVGGVTRLNRLNLNQIPKIAVILGQCSTSVYAASVATFLLVSGCYVSVYLDNSCHDLNEDIENELDTLNCAFKKFGRHLEFNFLSLDFEDIKRKTFDYIVTGLESDRNFKAPNAELIKWCFNQPAPILCIDPPNTVHIPWKVAAFIGFPTCSYTNLLILTSYDYDNGPVKPRSNFGSDIEADKVLKTPNGLVLLFDVNLPVKVYDLLNVHYKSPFGAKTWVRLYRD